MGPEVPLVLFPAGLAKVLLVTIIAKNRTQQRKLWKTRVIVPDVEPCIPIVALSGEVSCLLS